MASARDNMVLSFASPSQHILRFFVGHCKSVRNLLSKFRPALPPIRSEVNYRYANEVAALRVIAPDHALCLLS